jgi:hypothetical protein
VLVEQDLEGRQGSQLIGLNAPAVANVRLTRLRR